MTSSELTRDIARFASGFCLVDAPGPVVRNAKSAILDCLGVAAAASGLEIGRVVKAYAEEALCPGSCTVWGTPITTGIRDAALMNGMLAHGLDYDDVNHSTTYLLASTFGAIEAYDLPGSRLLEAVIAGREVRYSLDAVFAGRFEGKGPGARGWHANGILGSIAAAAATSRVLDLDVDQTTAAIGLAAGSCGALTRDGGTMAKPYRTGHAASAGIVAAQLAKNGATADGSMIEGPSGLLEALGPIADSATEALGKDLGKRFNLEDNFFAKKYPSALAAHAPLEAIIRLRERENLRPEMIDRLLLDLRTNTALRAFPERGYEGLFSIRFCIAMGVVRGDLRPEDFTDDNVRSPIVRGIMQRIEDVGGGDTLVVRVKDGRRLEEPLGERPTLTNSGEIEEKFHRCVAGVLSNAKAKAVVEHVSNLENLVSIEPLAEALRCESI